MAAASVSIITALIGILLFSGLGFSIAKVVDPTFYTGLLFGNPFGLLMSLVFMGISLGALFAGARFVGKLQAVGMSAMVALVAALVGSVMFWSQITSYTLLAFGALMGMAVGGLFASGAKGSKFGIGFDQAKKVIVAVAVIALVGTMIVVSGNEGYYKNQFTSSITGMTSVSASDIDNSTIEQMIMNANPRMTWDEFLVQSKVNEFDSLSASQQNELKALYHNYTISYNQAVAAAVGTARKNLANSKEASSTILNSLSFFKVILDNIALFYAISLAAMILLAGSVVIEPVAGATSWAFQKPLPERLQPKPKEEVLDVAWTGE